MSEFKQEVGLATLGGVEPKVETITLDSKDIGLELSGRRIPDALPAGSFQKLPAAFEWSIKKLDTNPEIVSKIIHLLSGIITRLGQASINFELFTQGVRPPQNLDQELLQLVGLTPDGIKRAAMEIGFSIKNPMHMDTYYIVLMYLYYYGCRIDNKFLRELCLTMLFVKLYRGRIYKFWKNGSDDTTTRYVISSKLRATNIAKVYPNTFDAIVSVWAPRIDAKYWNTVKEHPAHPLRGMLSILIAGYTRLNQAYVGLAKHYYDSFNAGYKTGSTKTDDEQMVERNSLSHVQLISDNVYNSITYSHTPVSDMDREYINQTLRLSHIEISRFEDYIKSPEHADEVKQTIELLVLILKSENANDIANINITGEANSIASARAKNLNAKLKDKIDNSLRIVYGNGILGASPAQVLKIRKCYILLYLLKIKQAYVKKSYYFEWLKSNQQQ